MKKTVLAIDQGTTSSRAVLFDRAGNVLAQSQTEFPQRYPQLGWVEHDPEDLFSSVLTVLQAVLAQTDPMEVSAIGITNQRETTVVWDKSTGKPIGNAIVWQCRRTADEIATVREKYENEIYEKTGLICDAYFSASKIKWLLDNVEGARKKAEAGELMFGTVDTWLLWRLTGKKVFATDYSNASRTMLFNIHTKQWDEDLCNLFSVPMQMLPDVYPSGHRFGETDESVVGARIPVCAMVGDQQSALFGQKCWSKGEVKNTYGTGCFMLMNTGREAISSTRGLVTTLGAAVESEPPYVLEGSVFMAGAVIQWLRDEMQLIRSSAESEAVAASVPDTAGVYLVPAFVGLGAPHWDSEARGLVCGLTRGANRAHLVRAGLESVAYQTFDVLHAMERDIGQPITRLKVDGGASANNMLMQFQADIAAVTVLRPKTVETTALGAAYLAGLASGFWANEAELLSYDEPTSFVPMMDEAKRQEKLLGWEQAVFRAKSK